MTELMNLPNDEGRRVAVFHAKPGSPSGAALCLLADVTSTSSRSALVGPSTSFVDRAGFPIQR
jgi:hypothetical protein